MLQYAFHSIAGVLVTILRKASATCGSPNRALECIAKALGARVSFTATVDSLYIKQGRYLCSIIIGTSFFCGALWDILPIEKSNAEVIAELQEERNHEEMIKRDGTIQALYPQCAHPTETTSPFEHLGSALLKINGPHNYPGR